MTQKKHTRKTKEAVREAVNSNQDIYQKVKAITLEALTKRQLDLENIQEVVNEVLNGVHEGVSDRNDQAKETFGQAASALDDALAMAAEASKLAIEEASSKISEYSKDELNDATENLKGMETLFLETLEKVFKGGNQMMADIGGDFILHARRTGTSVGKQVVAAMTVLKDVPAESAQTLKSGAASTTTVLAQLGSGILSGIAETLHSSSEKK